MKRVREFFCCDRRRQQTRCDGQKRFRRICCFSSYRLPVSAALIGLLRALDVVADDAIAAAAASVESNIDGAALGRGGGATAARDDAIPVVEIRGEGRPMTPAQIRALEEASNGGPLDIKVGDGGADAPCSLRRRRCRLRKLGCRQNVRTLRTGSTLSHFTSKASLRTASASTRATGARPSRCSSAPASRCRASTKVRARQPPFAHRSSAAAALQVYAACARKSCAKSAFLTD